MDARFIDHEKKKVLAVEMSCPWTENREKKQRRRPSSMAPSTRNSNSSSQDMTSGSITSSSMSGGWSTEVDEPMRELFGARGGVFLLRVQGAIISHPLNIGRTLKVMS